MSAAPTLHIYGCGLESRNSPRIPFQREYPIKVFKQTPSVDLKTCFRVHMTCLCSEPSGRTIQGKRFPSVTSLDSQLREPQEEATKGHCLHLALLRPSVSSSGAFCSLCSLYEQCCHLVLTSVRCSKFRVPMHHMTKKYMAHPYWEQRGEKRHGPCPSRSSALEETR